MPQDAAASSRVVYLRKRGAIGQVVALNVDQADVLSTHDAQRQQRAAEIALIWKRFEESGRIARSAEALLPDVRRYVAALEAQLAPVSARFTPLMAVQRRTGPEAGGKERARDDDDTGPGERPREPTTAARCCGHNLSRAGGR